MISCALRIALVSVLAAVVGGAVELCPEYASFLQANNLRCQQPPLSCTSNAECQFQPSDTCYEQRCGDGHVCEFGYNATCLALTTTSAVAVATAATRIGAATFRVLATNNTAQCHGYNAETQRCFSGLCDGGQCRELLGQPTANTYSCNCSPQRYLECRTDEHCLPLVAELPAERQACASAHCSTAGFCDLRQPLPPVPDGCCSADSDCIDDNKCTVDRCNLATGVCSHTATTAIVDCCRETLDCQGPPANRALCPKPVCDVGACLLTPTAPLCIGQLETCQAERFSYCAVETTVAPGLQGVLMCKGDPQLTLDRPCVMKYNNDHDCSYGTCIDDPLDNGVFTRCKPLSALNNTLFPCACACGDRPATQLVCGAPNTEFAYQCVPIGQGNNGGGGGCGSGGSGGNDLGSMLWFVFALIMLSSAVAIGATVFLFVRLMCQRRKHNKSQQL